MKKFLKWFFCIVSFVLLVAIVGAVVFVSQFDLNTYKPKIEQIVYEQTGRKLALNGPISLKISLVPTVAVKDVAFENASWANQKDMVKIKEADISLAVLPLLHKEIEIGEVNIIEPVINLALNKDGTPNWVFTKPSESAESESADQPQKEKVNGAAAPLLGSVYAQKIDIKNGRINYQDDKAGSTINLEIKSFELEAADVNDAINLAYDVVFNGQDIKGTATGDSINAILQNKPYNVKLSTSAYGATLKAKALLKDLMGDLSFDANLDLLSPKGNFNLPKTAFVGNVAGDLKKMKADISKLDFGGNIIQGQITADISGKIPNITGSINSDLIDLTKLQTAKKTAALSLISTAEAASFVPNEKLDLSVLKSIQSNIKIGIKKLVLNEDISLYNISTTVDVKNAVLTLKPLSMTAGEGKVEGSLSVNSSGNVINASLTGTDIIAQKLVKSLVPSDTSHFGVLDGGKTDLKLNLKTQGATYPKLVENLDGQILFVVGASKLQAGAMKYLRGNFISHLLSALSIEVKDPKMSLKCAVLRADFKDGKAVFPKGIVFDSKKMMVVGDGNINLKNDKIDIAIKPFNGNLTDTNIAQALSSLVKIGGTVSNPGISIDTASVVKNVVGVAMTGPVYLGSQLLLDADSAPCYTALKGTAYDNMFEAPKGVKAGAQNVYQGTSDAISSGINAVTGAAGAVAGGGVDLVGDTAKGVFNLLTGQKKKKDKSK
ncbi:MAG: AsmA family protein [Alphaproteobacteria bacterium]|nr:AsmA family protein [Alphaproteobacteria bacterium]